MSRLSLPRSADRLSRAEWLGGVLPLLRRGYHAVRRVAERLGFHVVLASYDAPIPRRAELTDAVFERASPMRGVDFDSGRQLDWVEAELGAFLEEFRPERGVERPAGQFQLDNGTFESVDAELLYAIVRRFAPARVVELGSGYSSLIIADALAANGGGEHRILDPFVSPQVQARPDLAGLVEPLRAQDVPAAVFGSLGDGDVLFVDTSHTVKMGGDVNAIVLDVLPTLAPGVVVHFHDIFLPRDYSRGHVADGHFWTEQYLLQAFLCGNRDWEVLVGGLSVAEADPERIGRLVASFRPGVRPGSFWIRRREGA